MKTLNLCFQKETAMFKTTLKKLEDTGLDNLLILALSVLLMLVMTDFRGHVFLVDDNRTQFFPVIEKIYQNFMATGRLALFNFHQMRGMIVADQGYYGQTNPLLFVSWLLARYLFTSYDCIAVYAVACVALGNVFWNQLLKKFAYTETVRYLVIAMTTCVSAFFSFGFWYYIFGCYLCVPMVLYGCRLAALSDGWKAYLWAGLSLFFSLTLGNSQYTFYQYLVFAITASVYVFLSGRYERIPRLLGNLAVAVAFSVPLLRLLIRASDRFPKGSGAFLSYPTDITRNIFFCALPHEWLIWLLRRSSRFEKFMAGSFLDTKYIYLFTGFIFPCVILYAFYWYYVTYRNEINSLWSDMRNKKEQYALLAALVGCLSLLMTSRKTTAFLSAFLCLLIWIAYGSVKKASFGSTACEDNNSLLVKSFFICAVFFLLFESGKGYVVARVMSLLPFVRQFRQLFKITFILSPLMAVVAAFMLNKLEKKFGGKILTLILSVLIILGVCNNHDIVTGGKHLFYRDWHYTQANGLLNGNVLVEEMKEKGVDTRNYRLLPFFTTKVFIKNDEYFDARLITSNQATYSGLYELGGYDGAYTPEGYRSVDSLLTLWEYWRGSGVTANKFFERCEKDTATAAKYAAAAARQLASNSVKYCVFIEDSPYRENFKRWLEEDGRIAISREIPLSNGTVLYELDGVKPLFTSASNTDASAIDEIVLKTAGSVENNRIETTFAYQKKLSAYAEDASGARRGLTVESDKNGNAVITGENLSGTTVRLRYEDFFASATLYYGLVLSAAVLLFLLSDALFSKPKKRSLRERS